MHSLDLALVDAGLEIDERREDLTAHDGAKLAHVLCECLGRAQLLRNAKELHAAVVHGRAWRHRLLLQDSCAGDGGIKGGHHLKGPDANLGLIVSLLGLRPRGNVPEERTVRGARLAPQVAADLLEREPVRIRVRSRVPAVGEHEHRAIATIKEGRRRLGREEGIVGHLLPAADENVALVVTAQVRIRCGRCDPVATQQANGAVAQPLAHWPIEPRIGGEERASEVDATKCAARSKGVADDDNDGLIDLDELSKGTDRLDPDSDDDGVFDGTDVFPMDASETMDTDNDGVGDNADAFPNDPLETLDSDADGVGDNTDAFPEDASETMDSDGDGMGDNEQKELEDEAAARMQLMIIIGVVLVLAAVGGLLFMRRKNGDAMEPKETTPLPQADPIQPAQQIYATPTPEPVQPMVAEPTVENQWTDENGHTWRRMSDGSTLWWNGTDWQQA